MFLLDEFRREMLTLFQPSPEGKIIHALSSEEKSFSELVKITGLSERWLSLKLKELIFLGAVRHGDNRYRIDHERLHALLNPSLKDYAWMATYEIVKEHPQVLCVLLFGSVAKGKIHEESDVDLLVVAEEPLDLSQDEYEISMKFKVQFEIVTMDVREFLAILHLKSSLLFGILEKYVILFDRAGITTLLKTTMKEIKDAWHHNEDEELWLKTRK